MAIKSRSKRATITSGAGAILSSIWSAYAIFTTAEGLPDDAEKLALMLADPPIYLPFLLLGVCVVVLAWSQWPRDEEPSEEAPSNASHATTSGHSSPALAGTFRDVIINPPPAALQERKYPGRIPPREPRSQAESLANRMKAEEAKRCPEMPIWKAVEYVAGIIGDTYSKDDFAETRRQLRQAAADDRIDVWGQKDIPPANYQDERHSTIWTPIEPTYWHDYELTPLTTVDRFDDRDHTWTEDLPSKRGNRYWSLRVRERQIKALWRDPKPAAPKTLQPDLPLNGFLGRVYKALGGLPSDRSKHEKFRRKVDLAILDAMLERHLHVWGREGDHGRRPIPREDIENAILNHRTGALSVYQGLTVYHDLKFVASEIDEIWPNLPETTNDGKP